MYIQTLSAGLGVIGSTDGPTAILVSGSGSSCLTPVLFAAALLVIAVSVWQARKKK